MVYTNEVGHSWSVAFFKIFATELIYIKFNQPFLSLSTCHRKATKVLCFEVRFILSKAQFDFVNEGSQNKSWNLLSLRVFCFSGFKSTFKTWISSKILFHQTEQMIVQEWCKHKNDLYTLLILTNQNGLFCNYSEKSLFQVPQPFTVWKKSVQEAWPKYQG